MLDSIHGEVVRKDSAAIVLRTGGVGFVLHVPRRSLERLPASGQATLFCHLAVRDDSLRLYGFESALDREVFLKLNSVAGVGGATALAILSEFAPGHIVEAIRTDQPAVFQRVKGIGLKTARRIVLELKGKVEELGLAAAIQTADAPCASSDLAADLVAALTALGFSRSQARDAAARALSGSPAEEKLENLIKSALAGMGS